LEVIVVYKIDKSKCLKCGICVKGCPAGAIVVDKKVTEADGLVLYTTRIDAARCTDCDVCVSEEWWCPAQSIHKV
jgi:ferredoxin